MLVTQVVLRMIPCHCIFITILLLFNVGLMLDCLEMKRQNLLCNLLLPSPYYDEPGAPVSLTDMLSHHYHTWLLACVSLSDDCTWSVASLLLSHNGANSLLRRNTLEKNTKNTTNASHPTYYHTTRAHWSLHYFCRGEPLLHFLFTLLYPSLHIVSLSLALLVNVLELVEKESEIFLWDSLLLHSFLGLICLKCRLSAEAKLYFLFALLHPSLHIVWQSFNNTFSERVTLNLWKKESESSILEIYFRCTSTASSLSLLKRKRNCILRVWSLSLSFRLRLVRL